MVPPAELLTSDAPTVRGPALAEAPLVGLTSDEAARRLVAEGPNELPHIRRQPLVLRFARQFTDLFAVVLQVPAAVTLAAYLVPPHDAGNLQLGAAILGVVLLNACIGFLQEYSAERTSALTGESRPVPRVAAVSTASAGTERPDLVFMGTVVVTGRGKAAVLATGLRTEFGRVYRLTAGTESGPSPLQRRVASMARRVAGVALSVGSVRGPRNGRLVSRGCVHLRARRDGGAGARGTAGHALRLAGDRRAPDGQAQRADQEAARGRGARFDHGDLHRQDRHADHGRDDAAGGVGGRPAPYGDPRP